MEEARLVTFTTNGWWPHDAVKNHGANSKKVSPSIFMYFHMRMLTVRWKQMAQAGFVYTPQIPDDDGKDDTASCLYCKIALGGWDPEDNPLYVYTFFLRLYIFTHF